MSTLRARIAILLVISIVAVVALATLAAMSVFEPPSRAGFFKVSVRFVKALTYVAMEKEELVDAMGGTISDGPFTGPADEMESHILADAIHDAGLLTEVRVVKTAQPSEMASIRLKDGRWLRVPLSDTAPPRSGGYVFAGWIVLIAAGSSIISVFAASKIAMPFRLIDSAMSSIGPSGIMAPIPEVGPAEARMTAKALNGLSQHLKTAIESRMRLVAAAGHDLRTPMTRMRLRAEFIDNADDRAQWLSDIDELEQIADSAISLVREEVSPNSIEPIELDGFVADTVESITLAGHRADVHHLDHAVVNAAPLALKRALSNLIVNSATHGGGATVSVTSYGPSAFVIIEDEGPGIPEALIAQVFEPFFRVDAARRKQFAGAGMGLAIAREIIARAGGTIELANKDGSGLRQVVTFPAC